MRIAKPLVEIWAHLKRMWRRYRSQGGDRLAAAVSYYGFLSFFPLVLLALSVVGFVVHGSKSAEAHLQGSLSNFLPASLLSGISLDSIGNHRGQIGALALLGLVISGTGWIGSLRDALRRMWGEEEISRNIFVSKIFDVGLLIALGAVLALSVTLSALTSQASHTVVRWLGHEKSISSQSFVTVVGYVAPFIVDVMVFGYLLSILPHVRTSTRALLKGSLLGALGFEVLKILGAYYVARMTTGSGKAIYGTFGVIIGLVVWLNLISRLTLFAGAWTATERGAVKGREGSESPEDSSEPVANGDGASSPAGASARR